MTIEELLSFGVPLIFLLLLAVESRSPARRYEAVPNWQWKGGIFFVLTLIIGSITPLLLPAGFLRDHSVLNLRGMGLWAIPLGILAATFFSYWFHRAEHRFQWLWRATHQLHHSPVRVDMLGAFYTHPLEVVSKVALGTVVAAGLLGLAPIAASVVGLTTAALSMFQHWNIRTPRALGYFVQRPESHGLHHERDVHARNFSDLPLWDMVFGTFSNPDTFDGRVGFEGTSNRVRDMLLMRDVNR